MQNLKTLNQFQISFKTGWKSVCFYDVNKNCPIMVLRKIKLQI